MAGHQALSRVDGEIGVFGIVARSMRVSLEFQCDTSLLLSCDGNVGIPFQRKQRNEPSSRDEKWKRAQIEVYSETRCSSLVGLGMLGNFLSCIKGVKYPFMFQEGTWYFSRDTALEKGLISR